MKHMTLVRVVLAARVCRSWREASATTLKAWRLIASDASAVRGTKGARPCELHCPRALCTLAQGELGVLDYKNDRIQIFRPSLRLLTRGFRGKELVASLPVYTARATAMVACEDALYLCDGRTGALQRRQLARDPARASLCGLDYKRYVSEDKLVCDPEGLAVDESGRLYVAEYGAHRVSVFRFDGTECADGQGAPRPIGFVCERRIGKMGAEDGELSFPYGVAVASVASGGEVFVADTGNSRVSVFDRTGAFQRAIGRPRPPPRHVSERVGVPAAAGRPAPPGVLDAPMDVAVVRDHLVVVEHARITVFTLAGDVRQVLGAPTPLPSAHALGHVGFHDDRLYVSDWLGHRIHAFALARGT